MLHTRSKTNNINTLNNPNCLQPQPLLKVSIPAFLKVAQFSSLESMTSLQTVYPSITFAQKTFSLTYPMSVSLPSFAKSSTYHLSTLHFLFSGILHTHILQSYKSAWEVYSTESWYQETPRQATQAINTTPKDLQVVRIYNSPNVLPGTQRSNRLILTGIQPTLVHKTPGDQRDARRVSCLLAIIHCCC